MRKLLNLLPWRRRRMEQELQREVRYHIERRFDDLRRAGVSDADARRRLAIEFGGIIQVQEEVRDTWIWRWVDHLGRDLRYAARALPRHPAFAITALLSLALGIGASVALFSLIDQVVLRRLPVPEPDRLVQLAWQGNSLSGQWGGGHLVSYPLCRDLQQQEPVFDGVFCRRPSTVNFSIGEGHEQVRLEAVSGSYFHVLGARPALGRLIDPSDDQHPGAHSVVVLSHRTWQERFGGAADVIGRRVLINNYPLTVIGVAPAGFAGIDPLAAPAVWIPVMMTQQAANLDPGWDRLLDRRAAWLHLFGRLKPGVTVTEARAALQPWFHVVLQDDARNSETFAKATAEQRRDFLASSLGVLPASRGISNLRDGIERPLWVLLGGTILLLLLASLNVAGLLLARGAARARELTTRLAVGATRGRIISQLLTESLLITVAGGALGLLAAPAVSQLLLSLLSQSNDVSSRIDLRVVAVAAMVTIVTGVLCGLVPALQTGRVALTASLNERCRLASHGGARLRRLLVTGQLAFTLVLLIGAGLFVQTVARLHDRVGFSGSHLVLLSVNPPGLGYSEARAEQAMRELHRRLQELPAVEQVAIANASLLSLGWTTLSLTIDGEPRRVTDRVVSRMRVGPGFFPALGTPLVAGRDFDAREVRAPGSPPRRWRSVIVNESFARRYFLGRNPIGQHIGLGNRPDTPTDIEIVGVVRDFSRRSLREGEVEQVFFPFWDQNSGDGTFYLKIRDDWDATAAALRNVVHQVDPMLPLNLRSFDEQIDTSLRPERMMATLSSAFGIIALLLAMVGLYGVMSFVVTQRTPEIGVRMALGASRATALWLVVRDAAGMIAASVILAVPAAWVSRRLVESQLFGVDAFDVPTIVFAMALLSLVGLGAAMFPAWRAASVNPTEALRL